MISNLLDEIKQSYVKDIQEIIENIQGNKVIYTNQNLYSFITKSFAADNLKNNNVNEILLLEDVVFESTSKQSIEHVIYVTLCEPKEMKNVASQIRTNIAMGKIQMKNHLYLYPNKNIICEKILEDEGVLESISVNELSFGFFPIENDIISLQKTLFFKQVRNHLLYI